MPALPNLDFLRACAVLSVVLEHILLAYNVQTLGSWQVKWIGVVGVFMFFVHTSLVLMWSLERKPHTLDFYIRRAFRIYPLAILTVAAVLLFHAPVAGSPDKYFQYAGPQHITSIVGAVLLVPNLIGNYLPASVMWSLPYEVQMYILLPVLFFFIKRNFSLWPLLLLWTFAVLLCRPLFVGAPHNFFLAVPYFLPGIMAFVGFGRYRARFPAWSFPIFLFGLWAAFLVRPGWRVADLLCLGLGLCLPLFRQITGRSLLRASHEVAKYSYGIYLSHPFAIVLGLYLLPHQPRAVQLAVIISACAALSVAAHHFVEAPLIRIGKGVARRAERRFAVPELSAPITPASKIHQAT